MIHKSTFELLLEQKPHFNRTLDRIDRYGFYADNSVMGCGKTYVACSVAKKLGLDLFIVCPLTVHSNWEEVAYKADLEIVHLTTPQSLASRRNLQPKHGYLRRKEGKGTKGTPSFYPTPKLKKLVGQGILFVFDEIQYARNINTYFLASKALVKSVGLFESVVTPSKCAFISTTPFDVDYKCAHLLSLINLIKATNIKTRSGTIRRSAITDLQEFFKKESLDTSEIPLLHDEIYECFLERLQPLFFTSMPLILEQECDIRNGFYLMKHKKDKKAIVNAVSELNSIFIRIDPETRTIPIVVIKRIRLACMKIEKAKIPLFTRLIKEELKDKKRKVVICVHFRDTISQLKERLSRYKPLVLHGGIRKGRKQIIEKFQEPTTAHRLLICNIRVGGVGISLHDLDGSYPRTMFISPDHNVTDIFQATGRINRVGGQSDSKIRVVYANIEICERSILNSIARKMKTIKETLDKQVKDVLKSPLDFEDYIEGGKKHFIVKK